MGVLLDETSSLNDGYSPAVNIGERGQQGALTNPTGVESSARYVKQPLIAVLVQVPPAMKYMEDFPSWVKGAKSLIEDRAISITGINSSLTWEFNETAHGNSGEMLETVTKGTYERSVPAFSWPEVYGKAITHFWGKLGRMMLQDPESGKPGIIATEAYQADSNRLPTTEANTSFTVLFYEPTPNMDGIVGAVMVSNMMPKSNGEDVMTRVIGEAGEAPTIEVEFTGISNRSAAVKEMARAHLEGLNKQGLNPDNLPAYLDEITSDVEAADTGFVAGLDENT